jgi:hypothetical protein
MIARPGEGSGDEGALTLGGFGEEQEIAAQEDPSALLPRRGLPPGRV